MAVPIGGRSWQRWGGGEIRSRVLPESGLKHLPESGKIGVELGGVALLELRDFAALIFVRGQNGAKLDEGAHDGDVEVNGALAAEDGREHGDTLPGEDDRRGGRFSRSQVVISNVLFL